MYDEESRFMTKTVFVKSNCPECGAILNVDVGQESVKCEYCGTVARVADKKKPPATTSPAPDGKVQPVIWVSTGRGSWTWVLVSVLPVIVIGAVAFAAYLRMPDGNFTGGSRGSAEKSLGEHVQWLGHKHPMLVDITGDGVLDVVGWVRFLNLGGGDSYDRLAAYDANTGNRMWDTGPLVNTSQSAEVLAALAGDKLLVADATGVLKAFSLANGGLAWQGVLGERAERICGGDAGVAAIFTKDERILKVPLATGQLMPAGTWNRETDCPPLQNDKDPTGPFFVLQDRSALMMASLRNRVSGGSHQQVIESDSLQGMYIDKILIDLAMGKRIALGTRSPGTRSPVASAYQENTAGKKPAYRSLWLSSVTSQNPLSVTEGAPGQAAAAAGRAVVVYAMQDSKSGERLSCLDENTGQIVWDVPIPASDVGMTGPITASPHHVFVPHWTYLDIFHMSDGTHKATIGVR